MTEEEIKQHLDMLVETKQETRLSNFKTMLKEYFTDIYKSIFKNNSKEKQFKRKTIQKKNND